MLRRKFMMLATGGYRWIIARVTAFVARKANIEAAPSADVTAQRKTRTIRQANLGAHPTGGMEANKVSTVELKASPVSGEASLVESKRAAKTKTISNLSGVLVGWLFATKTAVTKTVANLGSGIGAVISAARKITLSRKAEVSTGDGAEVEAARNVSIERSVKMETGTSAEVESVRAGVCNVTADPVPADGVEAIAERTSTTSTVSDLAFWYYPEVVEDGVVMIRQVYNATLKGDILEVT